MAKSTVLLMLSFSLFPVHNAASCDTVIVLADSSLSLINSRTIANLTSLMGGWVVVQSLVHRENRYKGKDITLCRSGAG